LPSKEVSAVALCLSLEPWKYPRLRTITPKSILVDFVQRSNTENDDDDAKMETSDDTIWFSQKRIVAAALQELQPKQTDATERKVLLFILKNYWRSIRMDSSLFLGLSLCLQKWWRESWDHEITQSLLTWSVEASQGLSSPHAKALLASIILNTSSLSDVTHEFSRILGKDVYTTWFLPIANVLLTKRQESDDILLQAAWSNLQGGKERNILSNVLELSTEDPRPLVQLICHVLSENQDLSLVASLMVRGDALDAADSSINAIDDWMDESDTEEEDEEEEEASKPSDSKKLRAATKYTRKEILTLVKLDKIHQDQIQQCKRDMVISSSTRDLAYKIVRAPWLSWGLIMFKSDNSAVFVQNLALLLQSTTSIRANAKVGVLSKLAFDRFCQEALWKHALQSNSEIAFSVFCDLLAHYLVALSDVDFLQYHTTYSGEGRKGIMAQDVIEHLRSVLYELYWTKPVMVTEIQLNNPRGRLLLSATKVWNLLYERWNRLVRHSFCDESTWWFPHLASKEGDGAVIPARERHQVQTEGDDDEDDDNDSDSMDVDDDDQTRELSASEIETDALADSFRDPKMARVLTSIPQAIPFDRRVKLFSSLLRADKRKVLQAAASRRAMMVMRGQLGDDDNFFFDGSLRERVRIRRAALYKDSMQLLNDLGPRLKHQVQVSFVNQHGAEEAGIDGGGVFKEFLDDLIKDGFAVQTGEESHAGAPPLFSVTPLQTLAVNLDMADNPNMQEHYQFLGRVLGKAVYESILVEPQFCLPFLNQLLAKTNSVEDLKNFDEEYYKNLNQLRRMSDAEIESLGLTFELTVSSGSSTRRDSPPRTVELIPGGRSVAVTKKNVFRYIHMVAHQKLNVLGAPQTRAFLRGFRDLIPASWVRLFSANELQKLISGDDSVRGIDVASLKKSMHYLGGYHISQPYIQDFWDILENDFTPEQQRKFLKFMTSCSRQPLLGFASLEPMPSIQQIRLPEADKNSKLPTSQTCMNLLKLPNYKNKNLLKEKLLAAVEAGAGFELT